VRTSRCLREGRDHDVAPTYKPRAEAVPDVVPNRSSPRERAVRGARTRAARPLRRFPEVSHGAGMPSTPGYTWDCRTPLAGLDPGLVVPALFAPRLRSAHGDRARAAGADDGGELVRRRAALDEMELRRPGCSSRTARSGRRPCDA